MERQAGLPTREEAWALLNEYTTNPGLIKHALAVEAALRSYAGKMASDEHAWSLAGLLHDFDYERWPDLADHPFRGAEVLEARGYPEWFRRAILSHADHTGVARTTDLERCLFACDELCGFITACALVLPDKNLHKLRVKSVRKRMKAAAFARAVSREDLVRGAEELGVDLDEHVAFVIEAMRSVASDLGLDGS